MNLTGFTPIARKAGSAGMIVCMAPDVCKTQVGPATVPIPYMIVSPLAMAQKTVPTVKIGNLEAFTMDSHTSSCTGDEPGALGGVVSGVNMGACRPIQGNFTVMVDGKPLCHTTNMFMMNCASPQGVGNTVGQLVFPGP